MIQKNDMPDTYGIYLDESGEFENYFPGEGRKQNVRLIGGIVVPPALKKREDALREELKTLAAPYFPQMKRVTDIHLSDGDLIKSGKREELREKLLEFFTTNMSEARLVFIYDLQDLQETAQPSGAQLYRHLMLKLLSTLVFYHPGFGEGKTILEIQLAHRRWPYPTGHDLDMANKGYLKLKEKDGKTFFTAITEADLVSVMNSLKESLGFICPRETSYKMLPYDQWDSPFMAAADYICNTLMGILASSREYDRAHSEALRKFGKNGLFFFCPSDYELPEHLLNAYYLNKPGEFIASYNSLANRKYKFSDACLLLPALEKSTKMMRVAKDPVEFQNVLILADTLLRERAYQRFDLVDNMFLCVRQRFEDIDKNNTPDAVWDPLAFFYHDISMRYSNHTGNVLKGRKHREMAEKTFQRFTQTEVSRIRQYHEFINRNSVIHTNEFAFGRAISCLEPVKEKEEKICKALSHGSLFIKNEVLGKIYGSLGQNYTFLKDYKKARESFDLANKYLEENKRNVKMQTSYRAHLAIEMNNRNDYEKELCRLFKRDTFPGAIPLLEEWMGKPDADAFDLHILLKGVAVFYAGEGKQAKVLIEKNNLARRLTGLHSHPWELITIVIGRLLKGQGDNSGARLSWQAATGFRSSSGAEEITFKMFGHCARAWDALLWLEQGRDGNSDTVKKLVDPIVIFFQSLKESNLYPGVFNPNKVSEDGRVWPGWFDDAGKKFLEKADRIELQSILKEFVSRFTFNYW